MNWKQQVRKALLAKGIDLTEQQVYDYYRGRNTQPETALAVAKAVAKVKAAHKRTMKKIQQLLAAAVLFFVLF